MDSKNTSTKTTNPNVWESYTREQCGIERPEKDNKSVSVLKKDEDAIEVIRDLEKRQEPVIQNAFTSNAPIKEISDTLIDFMKQGSDEFETRTGRRMTYAEMRAAWG